MNKIQIIEKFTKAKSGYEERNEDGYVVNKKFIAVIDGATSKKQRDISKQTNGQTIKNIIADAIEELEEDTACSKAVLFIQNRILQKLPESSFGHAAASAIIYSIKRNEVWSIGDCQMIVNDQTYDFSLKIDILLSQLRSFAIRSLLRQGHSIESLLQEDIGRDLIMPFLRFQAMLENVEDEMGYCIFNNSTELAAFPVDKIIIIPISNGSEIVFASDGYPTVRKTLKESEEELNRIIECDPLCYHLFQATKGVQEKNVSFDDRTYIRFFVS